MIEILPQSSETAIGFKVSGELTTEGYDIMLPKLDKSIGKHGKINLLVVMEGFKGWTSLEAEKDDFKFGTHQYRQVEKAAFVGDRKWQEWMVKIMDPFTRHTVERYFDLEQLDDAWQWIKDDE